MPPAAAHADRDPSGRCADVRRAPLPAAPATGTDGCRIAMRYPLPYAFAAATSCCSRTTAQQLHALACRPRRRRRRSAKCCASSACDAFAAAEPATRWRSASARPTRRANRAPPPWSSEVQSDVDLSRMMQELPAVEDLLESARRRADHPHAQRAAHAGRARRRERHPHRAVRAHSSRCASASTARCARWCSPNRALHAALISRLKIMAELDIAEKRLPQDGRITLRIGGTRGRRARLDAADARTASASCCVCSTRASRSSTLESRRHERRHAARASTQLITQPHGIILVTGPTGSGKTTTLYAALGRARRRPAATS